METCTMSEQKTNLNAVCLRCGETTTITANASDVIAWQTGELIQDVLGYLSKEERELLISKTCGKCFDEMFPGIDDWD